MVHPPSRPFRIDRATAAGGSDAVAPANHTTTMPGATHPISRSRVFNVRSMLHLGHTAPGLRVLLNVGAILLQCHIIKANISNEDHHV